jgi:hypothetical protein
VSVTLLDVPDHYQEEVLGLLRSEKLCACDRHLEGVPASPGRDAMLTVALADSEAEAFFCPGQCFMIWADGLVGSTVQAIGRAGCGVIARRVPPARAPVDGTGIRRGVADQAETSALMRAGARNAVITGRAVSASLAAGGASRPPCRRTRPDARSRRGWCCRPARR